METNNLPCNDAPFWLVPALINYEPEDLDFEDDEVEVDQRLEIPLGFL